MDEKKDKKSINKEFDDQAERLDEMGDIRLADDVISIVASLACQEVPGVLSMAGGITDDLNSLIGKENASKGVRLKFNNKVVTANVYVVVEYGYNIPEIALAIQEKVKDAIEEMTKFEVQFVDVHVEGVARRKVSELEKEAEVEENMADILKAQHMHAEATVANSFEAQLAMHREDQARLEQEQGISKLQENEKSLSLAEEKKNLADIPDDELSEEELAEKYHYKPVKLYETDDELEARRNKFFEED